MHRPADDGNPMSRLDGRGSQRRPIRPLDALLRYRTGSRYCRVGPEVMRI